MNQKLSALFTSALVTGFIASQAVKAEQSQTGQSADQMKAEKNSCKGEKNSCKGQEDAKKKKKKSDKNSCKNGCGEAKEKSEEQK